LTDCSNSFASCSTPTDRRPQAKETEIMEMTARFDRKLIEEGAATSRFLIVDFTVPISGERLRSPVNIGLVLDRSGSMAGAKIEATLQAASHALKQLMPEDHFALVIYDDRIDVLMENGPATPDRLAQARALLATVRARANTALCEGWLTGCREVARGPLTEAVSRVLLLTDGLANHGETNHSVIIRHAEELRSRGVQTSTFGFGEDFNEVLLGAMADAGGGRFHFIAGSSDIAAVIRQEVGDAMEVYVRDTRLVVEAPGVRLRSLNGFTAEGGDARIEVRLGDLNSGQHFICGFELDVPAGERGQSIEFLLRLIDLGGNVIGETRCSLRYSPAEEAEAEERNIDVLRTALEQRAVIARRTAYVLNSTGRFNEARNTLSQFADDLESFAGAEDCESLATMSKQLRVEARVVSDQMPAAFLKSSLSGLSNSSKSRDWEGSSRRTSLGTRLTVVCTQGHLLAPAAAAVSALQAVLEDDPRFPTIELDSRLLTSAAALCLDPVAELELVDAARAWIPRATLRVVLTHHAFEDSKSSHWHPSLDTRVSSLAGITEPVALIAYELLMTVLNRCSPRYDEQQFIHAEPRNCLFDHCSGRSELVRRLHSMDLCEPCGYRLKGIGVSPVTVRYLTNVVRYLAQPVQA
jgi:hypothetical protein